MDAAEDHEGAQLFWKAPPTRIHAKALFDVYEDEPLDATAVAAACQATLPPTVQVHDIASDDEPTLAARQPQSPLPLVVPVAGVGDDVVHGQAAASFGGKQVQDDVHTALPQRSPWADVAHDDLGFPDLAAPHFGRCPGTHSFEAIADETTAGVNSRELRTQCGPFWAHARYTLPDVYNDSEGDFGTCSDEGPDAVSDKEVDTAGLPCLVGLGYGDQQEQHTPLASERSTGLPSLVGLGYGDQQAQHTPLASERSADADRSLGRTLQKDFNSTIALGIQQAQSTPLAPERSADADRSLDRSLKKDFNSTFAFGNQQALHSPLAQERSAVADRSIGNQQAQMAPLECFASLAHVLDEVSRHLKEGHGHTTQFPRHHDPAPLKDPSISDVGGSQDSPIDEFDYESWNIFDFDCDADGFLQRTETQCRPLPQQPTSPTQFELLDLQPLEDSRAQLMAVSLAPSSTIQERLAALEAYSAATQETLGRFCSDGYHGEKLEPLQQQQACPEDDKAEDTHVILLADALGITSTLAKKVKKRKRRKARR